jgi:C4-type Zn-finger protein
MVSLEEAKQQIADLQFKVEHTTMSRHDLQEVEMSITRIGSVLQRMTGSREVDEAIGKLNRLIFTIRMVQVAFTTLEATTPIGWIYAIASWLGLAMTVGETVLEFST